MDYQNTRDTIAGDTPEERDQAVLEGLVNNTLTELVEDGVAKLRNYAFYNNTALTSVYLPNLTTIGADGFHGCTGLTELDFPKLATVSPSAFNGCSKLKDVIIRTSGVASLTSVDTFTGTPIISGNGAIYVPTGQLANYRSHNYWGIFFIADINDYPVSSYETISHDWQTIVSNPSNYNVGDTKILDLGTYGKHLMELVGKGVDTKADGSDNSTLTTWISKTLIITHNMNESNNTNITVTDGEDRIGWKGSAMRTWLQGTLKSAIPEIVRNAIKPVNKTQSIWSGSALVKDGQTTEDDVWIPSNHEIFNDSAYETQGPVYTLGTKIKLYNSSANGWWLRSASSSGSFRCVSNGGNTSGGNALYASGVALGFCL